MNRSYLHLVTSATLCACIAVNAMADDKLVIGSNGGNDTQISVGSISQITFNNGEMIIATADGSQKFQLASIADMHFDLATSAIDDIIAPLGDNISVKVSGGILQVTTPADTPIAVSVYDMRGMPVTALKGFGSVSVDFNSLAKGAYIVRANNKTIKFTR